MNMEIIKQLAILIVGFALLVKGADLFVDGASGIAKKFGISELIIGLTIVAMGTSAPEAAVSIAAAAKGSAGIPLRPLQDAYAYTHLSSPFPEEPDPAVCSGLRRMPDGTLACSYETSFVLRDSALAEEGLTLLLEVPETAPALSVTLTCEGTLLLSETLRGPGRRAFIVPLTGICPELTDYLAQSRKLFGLLLTEFDRVCARYGIPWYLICGGLIGVMRDGRLLPWDDDIDIAVTRSGYERLKEAAGVEWDGQAFRLLTPEDYGENVFLDYMTRFLYMGETSPGDLFDRADAPAVPEIHFRFGLDIHILDNAADSRLVHLLQTKRIQLLYALALGHRPGFEKTSHPEYSRAVLLAVRLLRAIGRRIPLARLLGWYSKAAQKNAPGRYVYLSNAYYRAIPFRFETDWFGTPTAFDDDGLRLLLPADAERYLRSMYGDYRRYPPLKDRQPSHRPGGEGRKLSEERYNKA